MIRVCNIKAGLTETPERVILAAADKIKLDKNKIINWKISKRSVDARDKSDIKYVYAFDIELGSYEKTFISSCKYDTVTVVKERYALPPVIDARGKRAVVVGSGPAGSSAALELARCGVDTLLIERGKPVDEREKDVALFMRTGQLNECSNIQFGEGGAGTFSDGKLNTGIKDARIRRILSDYIEAGAPEEIAYEAKPHIGTDRLRSVVKAIRQKIIGYGGRVAFETRLTGLIIEKGVLKGIKTECNGLKEELACDYLVLAVGHSARDTFEMLYESGVLMAQKPFSIGVRVEHPQSLINKAQYGPGADQLGAADYKLSAHLPNGRGAYTFCMCPGGVIVAAASEKGHLVTNGMSRYARDGVNANAALLVGVNTSDFNSDHPLAGMQYQRIWEKKAFEAGGGAYRACVQTVGDFLAGRDSVRVGEVRPSYLPGFVTGNLRACLPDYVIDALRQAIVDFDRRLRGFAFPDAILTGIETRSSSPVRLLRDELGQANIHGLYPCGEGAGYAGGIISAAVDGLSTAEKICIDIGKT